MGVCFGASVRAYRVYVRACAYVCLRVSVCVCVSVSSACMCCVNSEMRKAIHPFACLFAIADDLLVHISQDYVI